MSISKFFFVYLSFLTIASFLLVAIFLAIVVYFALAFDNCIAGHFLSTMGVSTHVDATGQNCACRKGKGIAHHSQTEI